MYGTSLLQTFPAISNSLKGFSLVTLKFYIYPYPYLSFQAKKSLVSLYRLIIW